MNPDSGDTQLTYWLLGALVGIIFLLARYILGRFSALESTVTKNHADFIKHQDIERYMRPLEKQIDQLNAQVTKLIDLQMEQLKRGNNNDRSNN